MNKFQAMNKIQTSTFCTKRANQDGTTDREIAVKGKTIAVINEAYTLSPNKFYVHILGAGQQIVSNLSKAFALCLDVFIENMAVNEVADSGDFSKAIDDALSSTRGAVESSAVVAAGTVTEEIHRFGNADDGRTHKIIIDITCKGEEIDRFKYAAKRYNTMHENSYIVIKAGDSIFSVIDAKMPGATYLGHSHDLRNARWEISSLAAEHDRGVVMLNPGDLVVTSDGDFALVELVRKEDGAYKLDNGYTEYWVYADGKEMDESNYGIDWQESKKNW